MCIGASWDRLQGSHFITSEGPPTLSARRTATKFAAVATVSAVGVIGTALVAPAPALADDAPAKASTTLFKTNVPPLANVGGVPLTAGAYGSSLYPKPGSPDEYYGLTDRGPNVDSITDGQKVEPLPDYQPKIGLFTFANGTANLVKEIGLSGPGGAPYNGHVNPEASTKETIVDLNGVPLADSEFGYDPEGLVAMVDGTFYISDEYGPYITHFDAAGKQLDRLSPFDGTLPAELQMRDPNKGMEGLTITPDGKTLVGMMQSALVTPDIKGKPKNVVPIRIVTIDIATGTTHEYLYMRHLDSAETNSSEITALGNRTFLVDERDGDAGASSYKKLFKINITDATDVGPASAVPASSYSATDGGLLVGGKSIEGMTGKQSESVAAATLSGAGITPVVSTGFLDVTKLVYDVDPAGGYFAHDKVEGVAVQNGTGLVTLSNDSDYGIDSLADGSTAPPYKLHVKTTPDGKQDDGAYLRVAMANVPAASGPGYVAPTLTASVAGGAVTVTATGLEPSTTYDLVLHSDPVDLGTLTTDANGAADATVAVPVGVTGTGHTIEAVLPNGPAATVSVDLTAVTTPPTDPGTTDPGTGDPGTGDPGTAGATAPATARATATTGAQKKSGNLANTGFDGRVLGLAAAVLLTAGGALTWRARRRS